MKISFWIPAVYLYVVSVVFSSSVQVGTVLFTTTDLVRKCWTESDKSLLKARLIMQDVLPDPDCINFSNPEAVNILLDYFKSCYHVIAMSTYGKVQHLMNMALSDALGGYLRAYVLPFTRRAYYAGEVTYEDAKKLFKLYEDIRMSLKTNGVGWKTPQRFFYRKLRVKPLAVTGGSLEACKNLYVIEKKGKFHCINSNSNLQEADSHRKVKIEPTGFSTGSGKLDNPRKGYIPGQRNGKNRWRRKVGFETKRETLGYLHFLNGTRDSERFFKNLTKSRFRDRWGNEGNRENLENRKHYAGKQVVDPCDILTTPNCGGHVGGCPDICAPDVPLRRVVVPLPILDDSLTPHSIAVPFKKHPLRNLRTECSAFVLEDYYLSVLKCFIAKGNTRSDIKNFNGQFHSWIVSEVVPHLHDEQWYPGFGGVLRVLRTIKKFGREVPGEESVLHDIAFMFNEGAEFEVEANSPVERGNPKVRNVEKEEAEETDDDIITDVGGVTLTEYNTERHAIIVILIVSFIWLLVFCSFAFFCQATRSNRPAKRSHIHMNTDYSHLTRPKPPDDNNIKLQFLIKFFKKDPASAGGDTSPHQHVACYNALEQKKALTCPLAGDVKRTFPMDLKYDTNSGDRDCMSYFSSFLSSVLPAEPYLASFDKRKLESPTCSKIHFPAQGDHVQTLWKKSSPVHRNYFREGRDPRTRKARYMSTMSGTGTGTRTGTGTGTGTGTRSRTTTCSACLDEESKGYTTEKHATTCYCSESCGLWPTSTTTSSTLVEEKLSSATLEFFEDVIAKHKARKLQTSTAESESEFCTSSETEY